MPQTLSRNPLRAAIEGALSRPWGHPSLERFVEPGDRVAVARPAPRHGDTGESQGAMEVALSLVLAAMERAGAAQVAVRTVHPLRSAGQGRAASLPLGWIPGGIARMDRQLVETDRLILITSRMPGAPAAEEDSEEDPCLDVLEGVVDPATSALLRASPDRLASYEALLLLTPPAFLIELVLHRSGRLAGVFAGEPARVHRAALSHRIR